MNSISPDVIEFVRLVNRARQILQSLSKIQVLDTLGGVCHIPYLYNSQTQRINIEHILPQRMRGQGNVNHVFNTFLADDTVNNARGSRMLGDSTTGVTFYLDPEQRPYIGRAIVYLFETNQFNSQHFDQAYVSTYYKWAAMPIKYYEHSYYFHCLLSFYDNSEYLTYNDFIRRLWPIPSYKDLEDFLQRWVNHAYPTRPGQ